MALEDQDRLKLLWDDAHMRRTATLGPVTPRSSMLSSARTVLDSLPPMPSAPWFLACLALAVTTLLGTATVAQEAVGESRYILATGRHDDATALAHTAQKTRKAAFGIGCGNGVIHYLA